MKGPTDLLGVVRDYATMLTNRGVTATQLAVIVHNHTPTIPCIRCGRSICDGPECCKHTLKPAEVPE